MTQRDLEAKLFKDGLTNGTTRLIELNGENVEKEKEKEEEEEERGENIRSCFCEPHATLVETFQKNFALLCGKTWFLPKIGRLYDVDPETVLQVEKYKTSGYVAYTLWTIRSDGSPEIRSDDLTVRTFCHRYCNLTPRTKGKLEAREEIANTTQIASPTQMQPVMSVSESCQPTMLLVRKLSPEARLPERQTAGSAGYDLFSPVGFEIRPQEMLSIPLDIVLAVPEGFYGRIAPKSSLALLGIDVNAGVIDSDYRGMVRVLLENRSSTSFASKPGSAIAQLILCKIATPPVVLVSHLDDTERGAGGFGSTENKWRSTNANAEIRVGDNNSSVNQDEELEMVG
jgi:dUTP pyrophosphatase